MGMYDTVLVQCPQCSTTAEFQSKGGECDLNIYYLFETPPSVLSDVHRHGPTKCIKCDTIFHVDIKNLKSIETIEII